MHDDTDLDERVLILDVHLGTCDDLNDLAGVPCQVQLLTLTQQVVPIAILNVLQQIQKTLNAVQLARQVTWQ